MAKQHPGETQKRYKNQRRTPRQSRALQKYNAVLNACTQVLGQQGYKKTTMLELSLESGVAVPTIYQYFDNKEAILLAWMDRTIEQMLQTVRHINTGLERRPEGGTSIKPLIDTLLSGALAAFGTFQPGIANLLQGLPHALSAQVLRSLEEKTLAMLLQLLPQEASILGTEQDSLKLRMLIRMICGYLLFSVLADKETDTLQTEGKELATCIQLYLQAQGLH